MDNNKAREKVEPSEYQNPFNDEFLTNLNQDNGNFNLNTQENEDEFLTSLNTELNMNYFPENTKKNSDSNFIFSNSKVILI